MASMKRTFFQPALHGMWDQFLDPRFNPCPLQKKSRALTHCTVREFPVKDFCLYPYIPDMFHSFWLTEFNVPIYPLNKNSTVSTEMKRQNVTIAKYSHTPTNHTNLSHTFTYYTERSICKLFSENTEVSLIVGTWPEKRNSVTRVLLLEVRESSNCEVFLKGMNNYKFIINW